MQRSLEIILFVAFLSLSGCGLPVPISPKIVAVCTFNPHECNG